MSSSQLDSAKQEMLRAPELSDVPHLTDCQLLECYIACHDESSFATLVHRYGRLVRSVCRHVLHHEQDIDDAFQATWMVFLSKASSIRRSASVSSWLYGVAYRTAMNAKRARVRRCEEQSVPEGSDREQPVTEAALREVQAILNEEVQHLSDKHRAPFILCCLEGKSRAEAAAQLGLKEGTVSSRLALARKELQKKLLRRGVALTAALCLVELCRNGAAASVPPLLAERTIEGTLSFAAGKTVAANLVSAEAVCLAKTVLHAMFAKGLMIATAALLSIGLLAGTGLLASHALTKKPAEEQRTNFAEEEVDDKDAADVEGKKKPSPAARFVIFGAEDENDRNGQRGNGAVIRSWDNMKKTIPPPGANGRRQRMVIIRIPPKQ